MRIVGRSDEADLIFVTLLILSQGDGLGRVRPEVVSAV